MPAEGRVRKAQRWTLARRRLVNLAVASLDFAHGEFRPWVPPSLRVWRPLNPDQCRQVAWLERLIGRWGRLQVLNLAVGRKGEELLSYIRSLETYAKTTRSALHSYEVEHRTVLSAPRRGFFCRLTQRS